MDLSGIIFVVLAVAWAVYLIPKALKHHDEVARTRSIDRFSTAMRVLARREPVGSGDARLVVTRARAADNPQVVVPATRPVAGARPRPRPAAQRAAARTAARRRRRVLTVLLLSTAVVVVLAAFAVLPWWSVTVPSGLVVLFLLVCRTQVRRMRSAGWTADLEQALADESPVVIDPVAGQVRRAARVEAPYGTPVAPAARNAQGFVEVDPDDDTMSIPAVVDAVVMATVDGGSLWDPLPVTLPTYVTKPKARRTVRTIDLGEPGTWTSGRTAEDAGIAAEAAAAEGAAATASEGAAATASEELDEAPRAVGS
ncbi:hypothetical protein [Nocardioides mesophilus]|uniref:Uncharacterized protein n=1 Tax=Nocardioides mesophilus TaxID=433659 RepID=A0A7G9R7J3_9ACTN|nr:hypothetical protein [Nocardioides mesophilus]QNN51568.1 hypothetical protein H9L09_13395 [Nocardioides mesophilus]